MALGYFPLVQLLTAWWTPAKPKVSDFCYPLGWGVVPKESSTGYHLKEPVIDLSPVLTPEEVLTGYTENIPQNVRHEKVVLRASDFQRSTDNDEASTSRSTQLSAAATFYASVGGGGGRSQAQQVADRRVRSSTQERNISCCLSLQPAKGDKLSVNADKEAALPTTWDPISLAKYILENGTHAVVSVAVGTRREHFDSRTEHEQGRLRESTAHAHVNATLPNGPGGLVNLDHSNAVSGSGTQMLENTRDEEYGSPEEAVGSIFEITPQSKFVMDPKRQRHLKNAVTKYRSALKRWARYHSAEDPTEFNDVPRLATYLSFENVKQTSKATSETWKANLQPQSQPQRMTRRELFSEGSIGFKRQYFVNVDPVRFTGGVPVSINLWVTGLKMDTLELNIERTNQLPFIFEHLGFGPRMMGGEWNPLSGPCEYARFQGIKVDCRDVLYSEMEPSKVHVLTGAKLEMSMPAFGEPVLSVKGYFSVLENAQFIKSKWESARPELKTASSAPNTRQTSPLGAPDSEERVESPRTDHHRAASVGGTDHQQLSLGKHVVVDSLSMGADVDLRHWVLSGCRFRVVEKQKLELLQRFSLYEYQV